MYISNTDGVLAGEFHPVPKLGKKKKRKKRKQQNNSNPKETFAEKQLIAEVFLRDKGHCQNPNCGVKVAPGTIPHHVIIKGYGGRGVLKELVDSLPLRVLLCDKCHAAIHHTGGGMKGYDFYIAAVEQGYRER